MHRRSNVNTYIPQSCQILVGQINVFRMFPYSLLTDCYPALHCGRAIPRTETHMQNCCYEVTGSYGFGARVNEAFRTLEEARNLLGKMSSGTIWFYSFSGRVRVETRAQAIRNASKGGR